MAMTESHDAPSREDHRKRLRGRNIATLAALLALVALFYLITIVRMGGH